MDTAKAKTFRLASAQELDIVKTFECGQCFRWNSDADGVYRGIALGYPARLWQEGEDVYIRTAGSEELWRDYFDLNRDYSLLSIEGMGDYLKRARDYGQGIRILNQEPWETLCSFIISQCNNIKRIKGIVERLSAMYGERTEMDGEEYFKFPTAQVMEKLTEEDLAPLRAGYRAAYLLSAARDVQSGRIDLNSLIEKDCARAKKELLGLRGVGEKVANCIVLFSLRHMEAFPIDVWIKRALKEHFPPDFDPASLGKYAGLAQQYIFFYARSGGE